MGHINEQVGRFTIESRHESFYIHADYGYEPETCAIRALGMGDVFLADGHQWQVTTMFENGNVEARQAQFSVDRRFEAVREVVLPGRERKSNHSLGDLWRDYPHPEIEYADLPDLITALQVEQSRLLDPE